MNLAGVKSAIRDKNKSIVGFPGAFIYIVDYVSVAAGPNPGAVRCPFFDNVIAHIEESGC